MTGGATDDDEGGRSGSDNDGEAVAAAAVDAATVTQKGVFLLTRFYSLIAPRQLEVLRQSVWDLEQSLSAFTAELEDDDPEDHGPDDQAKGTK